LITDCTDCTLDIKKPRFNHVLRETLQCQLHTTRNGTLSICRWGLIHNFLAVYKSMPRYNINNQNATFRLIIAHSKSTR
jgi:hypothetical protein